MSKRRATILFFFISFVLAFSSGYSQTIPKKNLNLFLGKVTSDPDSAGRYEFSQFEEWCYDTITDGRRWSWNMPYDGYWLYVDTNSHDASLYQSRAIYRFFLMNDVYGYGGKSSILTVWKDTGNDSIQFICAHRGCYGGGLALGTILRAGMFPDSSFYLCILEYFGDGGDYMEGNIFLRGTDMCSLERLYSTRFSETSTVQYRYDYRMLTSYGFDLIETSVYVTEDTLNYNRDLYPKKADSASARVINLWQLAKEKFGIK